VDENNKIKQKITKIKNTKTDLQQQDCPAHHAPRQENPARTQNHMRKQLEEKNLLIIVLILSGAYCE
jgi:hypothetical protein